MTPAENPSPSASSVLQELDALRKRLDQAADWHCGAKGAIRAVELANEVERLCREASLHDDPLEAESLLANASRRLDEFQKLLGVH